jgi:hypothetical protein
MWGAGDAIMLGALVLSIAAWLRAEERHARRLEARLARRADLVAADVSMPAGWR